MSANERVPGMERIQWSRNKNLSGEAIEALFQNATDMLQALESAQRKISQEASSTMAARRHEELALAISVARKVLARMKREPKQDAALSLIFASECRERLKSIAETK